MCSFCSICLYCFIIIVDTYLISIKFIDSILIINKYRQSITFFFQIVVAKYISTESKWLLISSVHSIIEERMLLSDCLGWNPRSTA